MRYLVDFYKQAISLLKSRSVSVAAAGFVGLLAGAVFAFGAPYFLLIPALAIFFRIIFQTNNTENRRRLPRNVLICFVFFFFFHATVFSWFLDADIGGLVAVGSLAAKGYAILSLVVMASFLSVPMAAAVYMVGRYLGTWYSPFLMSAAWVVGEWLRSLLFSIFLYGNGASIGDYWNFGSLGLAAMDGPFAASSHVVGLYGLTFLTAFLGAILYKILWGKKRTVLITAGLAIVVIACLPGWLQQPETDNKAYASVLQEASNVPNLGSQTPIENVSDEPKTLIVLPEYSSTYQLSTETFTQQFITSRLDIDGISVAVKEPEPGNRFGRLVFRNSDGRIVEEQTKKLLIPTGEYLPYIVIALYRFTGQPEVVERFEQTRRVQKGLPPSIFTYNGMSVGSVACSGILARDIFRQMSRDGANVLTNSASLLDFNHSQSYFRQSLQMARFHAMANDRTYVQSTVGAPAFVIDSSGRFIVEPGTPETKFIDFAFTPRSDKSVYTKVGEWPLVLSGILVTSFFVASLQKQIKARRNI